MMTLQHCGKAVAGLPVGRNARFVPVKAVPQNTNIRQKLGLGQSSFSAAVSRGARVEQRATAQRVVASAAASSSNNPVDKADAKAGAGGGLVTLTFIGLWYGLNIGFNLWNKQVFNYFPFPWTVSAIHVTVGLLYCTASYLLGFKKASFGRPINKQEFWSIFWPASMHAVGHIAANLSFAAVAISLTHTVKTMEPVFSVVLSKLLLGQNTAAPVLATLVPIMAGVGMASASDLSFNWMGFSTAMISNLTFGFRAVLSKKIMGNVKDLDSTAIYAWTTLISCIICVPAALIFEGAHLRAAADRAAAAHPDFYFKLAAVGLLYHLYNQFAFNTLSRVSPVSHGVCNVVKRVAIIISSVLFFGTPLSTKTKIGTAVALLGTYLYTEAGRRFKPEPAGGSAGTPVPKAA
jgi:Tpt phosphate/phosphoenolpyruvate translocator